MDIVFFNRVPKTGSIQMIDLMRTLGKVHDYVVDVDPQVGGIRPILNENAERDMVDNIANLDEHSVFVSHVNFLNFSKYDEPRPIYINMVRDPVERVISWYYYIRAPWIFVPNRRRSNREMPNPQWVNTEFDHCVLTRDKVCTYIEGAPLEHVADHRRQTLFFCGHNERRCMPFNSKLPLQIAKATVEREYAVVGTWEDTNVTLTVLENYIPRYFKGATKMYYLDLHENRRNTNPMKPHVQEAIKEMVRRNFTREIEFYQFCRQRLHKQYIAVKLKELIKVDKSLVESSTLDSLDAELLNNTRLADTDIIFFNRCAKVGSESLLELFNKLEGFNGLTVDRRGLKKATRRQLKKFEQRKLAEEIIDLPDGSVWIEHVNFIDFEKFELPVPIYINLVRDPVERVISWYFYARGSYKNAIEYKKNPDKPTRSSEWFKKDFNQCVRSGDPECQYVPYTVTDYTGNYKRQSMFYCGHDDDCLPFNSPQAVEIAKDHVERYYAVVGSWEDTNVTLTVFEKYIPRFFQGARILFELHNEVITNRNKNKRKPHIDQDVKEMIRQNMTHEYDFYHFCKQRLYKQYLAVSLENLPH